MACTKNLRTDYNPTASSGGTWVFSGYSTSPISDTSLVGVDNVYDPSGVQLVGNSLIGDDPLIDPSIVTTGAGINFNSEGIFYHYDYYYGACVIRVIVEIIPERCSGRSTIYNACETSTTLINIRQSLAIASPCGTLNNHTTPSGVDLSVITDDLGNELQDGVLGITIVNPGETQEEFVNPSLLTLGDHLYTNTSSLLNDYAVDCAGCVEDVKILTVRIFEQKSAGTIIYDPYLSVCDDVTCAVDLAILLSGADISGQWYYLGIQTGDVANPIITPTAGYFKVGTGIYQYHSANSLISNSLPVQIFLDDPLTVGHTYAFEWRVDGGTVCTDDSEVVYIRSEFGSEAGTPPSSFLGCYRDFLPNELGGNPIYNLWNQLTDNPTQPGTWTMNVNSSSGGVVFNVANLEAQFTPSNGDATLATYDFSIFDINTGYASLTFNYEATVTGTFLCNACSPDNSTWDIYLGAGCSASVSPADNTDYYNNTVSYPCSGCTVDAYTDFLKVTVGTCGYWRVKNATPTIVDLIVDGAAPNTFTDNDVINNGMTTHFNPELDWSNVPAGAYIIQYVVGTNNTGVNCQRVVDVYIDVTDPCTGSCINTVWTNNKSRQMTDLQLENFSYLSAQGGFNFPYGLEFTAQMDLFISDYKTWIEAQGCIVTSTASYYMDIANNLTYLYLDADQSGVGEHKNITIDNPNATINFINPVDCTPCATTVAIVDNTDGTLTAATGGCVTPIYLWSPNGETTQTITMTDSGTYTVDVTCTENGCLATDSFTCNADCGGEFSSFYFRSDLYLSNSQAGTCSIESFILDGTEYVPTPISGSRNDKLLVPTIIASDTDIYYEKEQIDILNSIGVPGVTFNYAPDIFFDGHAGTGTRRHRYIEMTHPTCLNFQLDILDQGYLMELSNDLMVITIGGSSTTFTPGDAFNLSSVGDTAITVSTQNFDCT